MVFDSIEKVYALIDSYPGITIQELESETGLSQPQMYKIINLLKNTPRRITETQMSGRTFFYTKKGETNGTN